MRLSAEQIEVIKQETENYFGVQAEVWLFGSRVDDAVKGGDIDLYVETDSAEVALAAARARGLPLQNGSPGRCVASKTQETITMRACMKI